MLTETILKSMRRQAGVTARGGARMWTALAILTLLLPCVPGACHPMGNFSINHYARFDAGPDSLHLRYVLDLAEIPTVTEKSDMGSAIAGHISSDAQSAYLAARAAAWGRQLRLTVAGSPVTLQLTPQSLQFRPGAGGLETLRLTFTAQIPLAFPAEARALTITYEDENFPQRTGWKEILAVPASGVILTASTAGTHDLSHELTAYPTDAGVTPPQQMQAQFSLSVDPHAMAAVSDLPAGSAGATTASRTPQDAFTQTIARRSITPGVLALGLLIAFIFGAFHALSPGHGKAMVAAYLVGARGTSRHAVLLGLTVTITHVLGVYALGAVTLLASRYVVPERLYTIMSVVSGVAVCAVGASLLIARLRGLDDHHDHHHDHAAVDGHWHDDEGHTHVHAADGAALSHTHDHTHEHVPIQDHTAGHSHVHAHEHAHDHAHPHEHDHVHAHDHTHDHGDPGHSHSHSHGFGQHHHHHLPEGPITLRSLIALGISGGIVPCPSALVVLLSAIALHRVLYGMLLITAFSAGLAAVLVAIGMTVVSARQWVTRLPAGGRMLRGMPIASAAVITLVGVALIVRALNGSF